MNTNSSRLFQPIEQRFMPNGDNDTIKYRPYAYTELVELILERYTKLTNKGYQFQDYVVDPDNGSPGFKAWLPFKSGSYQVVFSVEEIQLHNKIYPGVYTVVYVDSSGRECGHSTYRIRQQRADATFAPNEMLFDIMNGNDNESEYKSLGIIKKDGYAVIWPKDRLSYGYATDDIATLLGDPAQASRAYGIRSKRCGVCGRRLTVPSSIEAGIGPVCASITNY